MKHVMPRQRRPPGIDSSVVLTSQSLSPNHRHVIDCMWQMGYGTIRGLHVCNGDFLLVPQFQIVRKVRLSEEAWSRCEPAMSEFTLKREHIRFLKEISTLGTCVIEVKVVKGLPVDLDIYE